MAELKPKEPMTRVQIIDTYFLEHRAKLLDIAAFLDRIDRAPSCHKDADQDYRVAVLRHAMTILGDDQPDRAKRVLELLSDTSQAPIDTPSNKAATGAYSTKAKRD